MCRGHEFTDGLKIPLSGRRIKFHEQDFHGDPPGKAHSREDGGKKDESFSLKLLLFPFAPSPFSFLRSPGTRVSHDSTAVAIFRDVKKKPSPAPQRPPTAGYPSEQQRFSRGETLNFQGKENILRRIAEKTENMTDSRSHRLFFRTDSEDFRTGAEYHVADGQKLD